MKTLKPIFTIVLFIVSFGNGKAQEKTHPIIAKIENKLIEGSLELKATVTNKSEQYRELNYLFVSIKKGSSGNLSNNKQNGKFTLNPNETKVLSLITVNLQKNDELKVFLYVRDEESKKLVSKDSLVVSANSLLSDNSISEIDIFELKGLTIDDTKTKLGKDFYDLFYLEYSKLPEKYSSPITISELPAIGRSSQLLIWIDDKNIYSFFSNPSEDFLKDQASLTMKILSDFQQKKALVKDEFKY